MSESKDPTFYGDSGYERLAKDRYFTDPWITNALRLAMPEVAGVDLRSPGETRRIVWEPAAGRGDIADVIGDSPSVNVFCSDIDLSELKPHHTWYEKCDFLNDFPTNLDPWDIDGIVTNPPFVNNMCESFIRRAVDMGVDFVAMLTRLEFGSAKKRMDLFRRPDYAGEIKLTTRPRWDWWWKSTDEIAKSEGPRHYYSWHVWTLSKPSAALPVQVHVSEGEADLFAGSKPGVISLRNFRG